AKGYTERCHIGRERPHRGRRGQPLLPAGVRQQGPLPPERHDHALPLEGGRELSKRRGGRKPRRRRGLVLPGAQGGGGEHQGPRRLLRQQGGGRRL
ncbi:MAG: hypothetical protein AVDCRST_MAG01-01-2495, partial [uncultured Rubrobacteraceae bacterium]